MPFPKHLGQIKFKDADIKKVAFSKTHEELKNSDVCSVYVQSENLIEVAVAVISANTLRM